MGAGAGSEKRLSGFGLAAYVGVVGLVAMGHPAVDRGRGDVGDGPMKLVREPEPSIRGISPPMVVDVVAEVEVDAVDGRRQRCSGIYAEELSSPRELESSPPRTETSG